MREKGEIACPSCKAVYLIDMEKIPIDKRKSAKCAKCQSRFYVENHGRQQNKFFEIKKFHYIMSYFEKRSGIDRRNGIDRRRKINLDSLPFWIPDKDIIPFFDKNGNPAGFFCKGRRNGKDRRRDGDRRGSLYA